MHLFRSITTATLVAATVAVAGTAAQASAPQAPPPASAHVSTVGNEVDSEALFGWTYRHDGAKGIIRNTSDKTVVVSLGVDGTFGTARLAPGQSVQFADSMGYDVRSFHGVQGARLRVWLDGQSTRTKPVAQIMILDHTVYRPISQTDIGSVSNYRDGWREGQSHWEINGDTRIELRREGDNWRGRFERSGYTDDWAAFSININGIS